MRADRVCGRFAPAGTDLGVEDVVEMGLTRLSTCVLSAGRVLCADRFGGPFKEVARGVDFLSDAGGYRHVLRSGGRIVVEPRRQGLPDAVFEPLDRAVAAWGTDLSGARLIETRRQLRLLLLGDDGSSLSATILSNSPSMHGPPDPRDEIAVVDRDGPRRNAPDDIGVAFDSVSGIPCHRRAGTVACEGENVPVADVVDWGGSCVLAVGGDISCFDIDHLRGGPIDIEVLASIPSAKRVFGIEKGGCAVTEAGQVMCFGDLGDDFSYRGMSPFREATRVPRIEGAVDIKGRDGRYCARTDAGRVLCFGCLSLHDELRVIYRAAWPRP